METFTQEELTEYELHMNRYMIMRTSRKVLNEFHNQTLHLILNKRTI